MSVLAIVHVVVLLVLVVAALGLGIATAVRPSERRYGMLRPISWATAFASVSTVCAGLSQSAAALAGAAEWDRATFQHGWAGVAESLVPAMFGFGFLAVAWGLAAIGLRRLD
jgi:hypothetical protein